MSSERVSISISKDLYNTILRRIQEIDTEFNSVEDFIEFILREVLKEGNDEEIYMLEDMKEIGKEIRTLSYF